MEMTGAVENVENQTQVFHVSHRSLKISQNRRDSHIPTAPACTAWKSGKTKDRFPTFPPGARDDDDRPICELKDQRKEVGRYATSSFSCPDFMLIFQLENAKKNCPIQDEHETGEIGWSGFQCKMSMKRGRMG